MSPDEEYDAFYAKDVQALCQRVLDSGVDLQTQAGVTLLMATFMMSFASAAAGRVAPELKNAPMQAQIDYVMKLMREILVEGDRPKPTLVSN